MGQIMSKKTVTVFGATGAQGGSVVKAIADDGTYDVRAVTRNANSDKAKALLKYKNVKIIEADLDKPESLDKAFSGAYGAFLVTDFTAHFDKREPKQGKAAIDSAIKNGVQHFIFSSLDDVKSVTGKRCEHFDQKFEIEKYGLSLASKINFTAIRLPAYYENFTSFLPQKSGQNEYLLNFPLEGKEFYSFSVGETGPCVLSILKNPQEFSGKVVGVAGDKLKLSDMADIMTKHLSPNKFVDTGVTAAQYAKLGFPGAQELAIMCEYYQTGKMQRDIQLTKRLNKNTLSFEQFIIKNREHILKTLPK